MNEPTSIRKKNTNKNLQNLPWNEIFNETNKGGPLPVINGVITPIHGLIDGYL